MLKTEELQALLRSAVSQLLTQDVKGTVGLVPMYGCRRFRIHEDELKLIGFPVGINSETASDIFNIGVREICGQIQESASALSEEMLMSACDTVVKELRACDGEHLFVFFVPDIILAVDESIEIGDAMLRKAAVTDTELLEGRANVVVPLSGDAGPLDESDFLKRYLGSALVELRFSGCQFKNELSMPGDAAWKEIRRLAGFLMACKELLQIPEASYVHRGPDLSAWPKAAFMVAKHGSPPLIPMYSYGSKFPDYGLEFAIDSHVLEQLKKFCHLEAFNHLCRCRGELRDKIYRSLDWFLKGCCEEDPTDRLVCFFISFESLLAMGTDALTSQTDDLAENIALLIHRTRPERIEEKNFFKKMVYPLRNRVMHHGHTFETRDGPISERLRVYIVYGLFGILKHLDAITKDGGLRQFFERVKMGAAI